MREELLISIIIPVYNAELFLEECIASILAQTYKKLEIIFVNDGSDDRSAEILHRYTEDKRMICINQTNQGSALARKAGVALASGEYITFIDADDWVEPQYIQEMCEKIDENRPDVITCGEMWEFSEYKLCVLDSFEPGEYSREQIEKIIIPQMLYSYRIGRQGISGSLCNKFIKADLLKEELGTSSAEFLMGDDAAVAYPVIFRTHRLVITDICGYHYRQHEMSMVHQVRGAQFDELKSLSEHLRRIYKKYGYQVVFEDQVKHFLAGYVKALTQRMFGLELMEHTFIPPVYSVPKGSRILLYGAGKAGRDLYRAFQADQDIVVQGWFDKNYQSLESMLPVSDPVRIPAFDFDYIFIAIADREIAEIVRKYLNKLGIVDEKILWRPLKMYE